MRAILLKWLLGLTLLGIGLGVWSYRTGKPVLDLVFPPRRIKRSLVPKVVDLPPMPGPAGTPQATPLLLTETPKG